MSSEESTAICCDCSRRADLCYFSCENNITKELLCARCHVQQMIKFALKNGFVPKNMGPGHEVVYEPEEILDTFGLMEEVFHMNVDS